MASNPIDRLERYRPQSSDGGVNPTISDSATFAFPTPDLLKAAFHDEAPGCFLYSRSGNASTRMLAGAMAAMEGSEAAHVTASGISAIAVTLLQLASAGNQIVASHTIYGGTWALLSNLLPRLGIETRFVDTNDIDSVHEAITGDTAAIYCETLSNPMLRIPDLPALAQLARESDAALVVDNTFAPLLVSPVAHGADIVVHSLTKYINGASDCVAGAICANESFIASLGDVADGPAILLGPVLDSLRAQSIYKNMGTLDVRMERHSRNAQYLAEKLTGRGLKVTYPGLPDHPDHACFSQLCNEDAGYGGMLTLDAGSGEAADDLARRLQAAEVGILAVSLGYYRTLFSPSGASTSSEIPPEMQNQMGLSPGLLRFSVGLDHDIEATWERFAGCLAGAGLLD